MTTVNRNNVHAGHGAQGAHGEHELANNPALAKYNDLVKWLDRPRGGGHHGGGGFTFTDSLELSRRLEALSPAEWKEVVKPGGLLDANLRRADPQSPDRDNMAEGFLSSIPEDVSIPAETYENIAKALSERGGRAWFPQLWERVPEGERETLRKSENFARGLAFAKQTGWLDSSEFGEIMGPGWSSPDLPRSGLVADGFESAVGVKGPGVEWLVTDAPNGSSPQIWSGEGVLDAFTDYAETAEAIPRDSAKPSEKLKWELDRELAREKIEANFEPTRFGFWF